MKAQQIDMTGMHGYQLSKYEKRFRYMPVFNHRSLLHGEKNMIVGLAIGHAYGIRNVGNILPMFLTPCIMGVRVHKI